LFLNVSLISAQKFDDQPTEADVEAAIKQVEDNSGSQLGMLASMVDIPALASEATESAGSDSGAGLDMSLKGIERSLDVLDHPSEESTSEEASSAGDIDLTKSVEQLLRADVDAPHSKSSRDVRKKNSSPKKTPSKRGRRHRRRRRHRKRHITFIRRTVQINQFPLHRRRKHRNTGWHHTGQSKKKTTPQVESTQSTDAAKPTVSSHHHRKHGPTTALKDEEEEDEEATHLEDAPHGTSSAAESSGLKLQDRTELGSIISASPAVQSAESTQGEEKTKHTVSSTPAVSPTAARASPQVKSESTTESASRLAAPKPHRKLQNTTKPAAQPPMEMGDLLLQTFNFTRMPRAVQKMVERYKAEVHAKFEKFRHYRLRATIPKIKKVITSELNTLHVALHHASAMRAYRRKLIRVATHILLYRTLPPEDPEIVDEDHPASHRRRHGHHHRHGKGQKKGKGSAAKPAGTNALKVSADERSLQQDEVMLANTEKKLKAVEKQLEHELSNLQATEEDKPKDMKQKLRQAEGKLKRQLREVKGEERKVHRLEHKLSEKNEQKPAMKTELPSPASKQHDPELQLALSSEEEKMAQVEAEHFVSQRLPDIARMYRVGEENLDSGSSDRMALRAKADDSEADGEGGFNLLEMPVYQNYLHSLRERIFHS
jgi:hypothetical protein